MQEERNVVLSQINTFVLSVKQTKGIKVKNHSLIHVVG